MYAPPNGGPLPSPMSGHHPNHNMGGEFPFAQTSMFQNYERILQQTTGAGAGQFHDHHQQQLHQAAAMLFEQHLANGFSLLSMNGGQSNSNAGINGPAASAVVNGNNEN